MSSSVLDCCILHLYSCLYVAIAGRVFHPMTGFGCQNITYPNLIVYPITIMVTAFEGSNAVFPP